MSTTLMRRNSLFPEFSSIFDDFFSKDLFDWKDKNYSSMGSTLPSVNLRETTDDFHIEVAAPGLKKEDFHVELDKNVLTISAEKKTETEESEKNGKYTRREFNYQSFQRSFSLPEDVVQSDKIEAVYQDGILKIQVPKKEKAKPQPKKSISVS